MRFREVEILFMVGCGAAIVKALLVIHRFKAFQIGKSLIPQETKKTSANSTAATFIRSSLP